jgi:hypothetical protein
MRLKRSPTRDYTYTIYNLPLDNFVSTFFSLLAILFHHGKSAAALNRVVRIVSNVSQSSRHTKQLIIFTTTNIPASDLLLLESACLRALVPPPLSPCCWRCFLVVGCDGAVSVTSNLIKCTFVYAPLGSILSIRFTFINA